MKKIFSCFSPKGSPNRNRNPRNTAFFVDNPPRLARINTSAPARTTFPAPSPTPVPSSDPDPASSPNPTLASASTYASTNRGKSEEKYSASASSSASSPATLERINELTVEAATLRLRLGPMPIQRFTLIQLQLATDDFSPDNCVGRGGFGRVYKGILAPQNQEVAIKCLDPRSDQGTPAFVTEVEILSNADHENIVRLIGYCAENEHRMLVYEYIRMGTLEQHLLKRYRHHALAVLDWNTRIRIAYQIAKGVDYLHRSMNPRRIYRDLKCANVLLGEGYTVKLSDFGCAKEAPPDENALNFTRVLGTTGYLDPRYFTTGNCTFETDVYSFGVILLELVTGRKCIDFRRPPEEQTLIIWATRVFDDKTRFKELLDPLLDDEYDEFTLYGLITLAQDCIRAEPDTRPKMSHIVDILSHLNELAEEPKNPKFRMLTRTPTVPSSSAVGVRFRR